MAPRPVRPVSCLCPDCHVQMTPQSGPLTSEDAAPTGRYWTCPICGIERMHPDEDAWPR